MKVKLKYKLKYKESRHLDFKCLSLKIDYKIGKQKFSTSTTKVLFSTVSLSDTAFYTKVNDLLNDKLRIKDIAIYHVKGEIEAMRKNKKEQTEESIIVNKINNLNSEFTEVVIELEDIN